MKLPSSKNGIKDGKNCGNSYGDCDGVKKTDSVAGKGDSDRKTRTGISSSGALAAAGSGLACSLRATGSDGSGGVRDQAALRVRTTTVNLGPARPARPAGRRNLKIRRG